MEISLLLKDFCVRVWIIDHLKLCIGRMFEASFAVQNICFFIIFFVKLFIDGNKFYFDIFFFCKIIRLTYNDQNVIRFDVLTFYIPFDGYNYNVSIQCMHHLILGRCRKSFEKQFYGAFDMLFSVFTWISFMNSCLAFSVFLLLPRHFPIRHHISFNCI